MCKGWREKVDFFRIFFIHPTCKPHFPVIRPAFSCLPDIRRMHPGVAQGLIFTQQLLMQTRQHGQFGVARIQTAHAGDKCQRLLAHALIPALVLQAFQHGHGRIEDCLLYTSPSPRDATLSRMPSSA